MKKNLRVCACDPQRVLPPLNIFFGKLSCGHVALNQWVNSVTGDRRSVHSGVEARGRSIRDPMQYDYAVVITETTAHEGEGVHYKWLVFTYG